jgi:O-6-methylguanine DNA methyltransferase
MFSTYKSPFGNICFETNDKALTKMWFGNLEIVEDESPLISQIKNALCNYFEKGLKKFDIPLDIKGTPFQIKVFNELLNIPFGTTKSYQEIAISIGSKHGFQAVGQACKRNPIGIIIPCHRVIGKDGSMTGYSGKGYIDLKEKLLNFEKSH